MANKIVLKKSSVAAKVPVAGDLDFGELAINYTDGKLYFKKADNTIDAFTTAAASAPVTSVGGNIGDITDAQLLASIKNVDGTGSGLDADTLDGNHASAFYLASNPNGYTSNTGTVTSVGATAPLVSSGGTAPSISIPAANSTTNGYMSSAYASKLDGIAAGATANTGTVTSVSGTGSASGLSLSGTVTTSGSLTLSGTVNSVSASSDQAIVNQHNGNSSVWYGRILSKNSTNDRAAFLGTYGGIAGVFAHNNALNAWADLYINTVDGSGGGTVRLPSSVLINGSQAIHAGNYTSYAPSLTGSGASGTWGINITGNADTVDSLHASSFLRRDVTNTMFEGQGSALAFENQSSFFRFAFNELRFYDWNNGQDILTLNGDVSTPNYFVGKWDSSGRNYSREWIEFPNYSGLYSPLNGAHFYPNNASYGSWRIAGTRNGWYGLEFDSGISLMMNDNACGFHRNTGGGWRMYVESNNIYASGQIQAGWSDSRLKDNQQKVTKQEIFSVLSKTRAHKFNWNSKAVELGYDVKVGDEEIGLIAQHVKSALPIAAAINKAGAKVDDDGNFDYLTIRWDKITPFLVEAVNIHEEELSQIKEENQNLKKEIDELKALLNRILESK